MYVVMSVYVYFLCYVLRKEEREEDIIMNVMSDVMRMMVMSDECMRTVMMVMR